MNVAQKRPREPSTDELLLMLEQLRVQNEALSANNSALTLRLECCDPSRLQRLADAELSQYSLMLRGPGWLAAPGVGLVDAGGLDDAALELIKEKNSVFFETVDSIIAKTISRHMIK